MKRKDALSQLRTMNLADLKREVLEVEKKIQIQKVALAFGKTKEVRNIRNLKRQLARALTIANQALTNADKGAEK